MLRRPWRTATAPGCNSTRFTRLGHAVAGHPAGKTVSACGQGLLEIALFFFVGFLGLVATCGSVYL